MQAPQDLIVIGRVIGAYGIRGWVKINPYTRSSEDMLDYMPWYLLTQGQPPMQLLEITARLQNHQVVAHWQGCEDRDKAALCKGAEIAVSRTQLPPLQEEEYYWTDLQGLSVITDTGVTLGTIEYLFETGANDVIVVKGERERMLPYIASVVLSVDLTARVMRVHWDPEF